MKLSSNTFFKFSEMASRVGFSVLLLISLISASSQNVFFTDPGSGSGFNSDCDTASTSLLPSSASPTSNGTLTTVHSSTFSTTRVVTIPVSSTPLPTSIDRKLATSTNSAFVESVLPTSTSTVSISKSTTMSVQMVTSDGVSTINLQTFTLLSPSTDSVAITTSIEVKPSSSPIPPSSTESILPSSSIPSSFESALPSSSIPPSSESILPSTSIPPSSSELILHSLSSSFLQTTYLVSTDTLTSSLLTTTPLMSVQSFSSSSHSISLPSIQPSLSLVPRSMSVSSTSKIASTTSFERSVSPSLTPTVSSTIVPQSIVPIAVSAGSVLAIVIICVLLIICVVICIRKRKRRLGYVLKTAGVDGTTEAKEYKLYDFTQRKHTDSESNVIFGQQAEASAETFGKMSPTLNSPVEIDLGTGGKITFPDTPVANSRESLPALIIYNPVKSEEVITSNTLTRGSKTLPTRGNQKCSVDGTELEVVIDHPLGTHVKSSKSTSEINSVLSLPDVTQVAGSDKLQSPVYDRPRVLKTAGNEKTIASRMDVVSGEYVTMEPHSQLMSSNKMKQASDIDRLAPKLPSVSSEPVESLYDNPRLIRSKKITNTDKTMLVSSPEPQVSASTIYDVPRSILTELKPEGASMPVEEKVKKQVLPTTHANISEGVYDIPKQQVTTVEKVSDISPVSKPEGIYDHPRNVLQPDVLTGISHTNKEVQSNQIDKATASDYKDTKSVTGPSKPKPSLPPKPNITSRKPAPYENVVIISSQSTDTQVTSAGSDAEDEHDYEMPPPRYDDDIDDVEVNAQQPEVVSSQLEEAKPKPFPKPRPKPRKLAQLPLLPQNIMQELYTKQGVKSKDSDRTTDKMDGKPSPKHAKPPIVKPKPKIRQ